MMMKKQAEEKRRRGQGSDVPSSILPHGQRHNLSDKCVCMVRENYVDVRMPVSLVLPARLLSLPPSSSHDPREARGVVSCRRGGGRGEDKTAATTLVAQPPEMTERAQPRNLCRTSAGGIYCAKRLAIARRNVETSHLNLGVCVVFCVCLFVFCVCVLCKKAHVHDVPTRQQQLS